ncbi:MAG: hypothetical protein L0I24_09045 [Pseudonocardia sp.]|nr:hypothetical protein [Pseudonocardia sp.]
MRGDGTGAPVDSPRAERPVAWLVVTVALLVAVVVVVLLTWAAQPRSDFSSGSFAEVEAAFGAAGLQVCTADEAPDPLANQAVATRTYELATACPADPATVVVDRFADVAHRDAAARHFEILNRPRGSGVVYTLGDTTIFVPGSGDHEVQERLGAALRSADAR